jgi:ABC-type branched-subunit amino acid transport system ATPase component/branched-subunit amino acid ABC-type transport system permease component
MQEFLPFIVIGLATGAVYGLAGVGLVLTYKTSSIFNFAYGSIAFLVALIFYVLYAEEGWPWPLAAAVCMLVIAPALGLLLELLARLLDGASETIKIVTTVGLILIILSIAQFWREINPPTFPHFLSQNAVKVFDVYITDEQIILFILSAAASGLLYWFFRSARTGIVMRALVDSQDLVSMSGYSPVAVRRTAWLIGTIFAGLAGLLLAPGQALDGISLTILVFSAFGAAAIGYFSNLPLTFAGGLIIGIGGALISKYAASASWESGLSPSFPFIVLFVVLIVVPRRRLASRRLVPPVRVRRAYQAPARLRLSGGAVVIALLAAMPILQGGHIALWSAALINVILFLSLGLLVRRSGQISLCQMTFAAVGAAALGHFTAAGVPWLVALILAALVAIPVGAIIAIPAIRVSGVYLALATLGFGLIAQQVFYTRNFMFGTEATGLPVPRPDFSIGGWNLSTDKGFYYFILVVAVLVVAFVIGLGRGRIGRLLEAMGDAPAALETRGTSLTMLKVIVFCICAALASLAGALSGSLDLFSVGDSFPPFQSLTLVVLIVIITVGEPWYALIAAISSTVISGYFTSAAVSTTLQLIFGVSGALVVIGSRIGGTPPAVARFLDRLGGRQPAVAGVPTPEASTAAALPPARAERTSARVSEPSVPSVAHPTRTGLAVRDLSVSFGGVKAVNGVSFTAPMGAVTGLVGPNGAGKTTTFNACSGVIRRPASGRVSLHDTDITGQSASSRARLGLGRTFQRPEVFGSFTVRQAVAMGREAPAAGASPLTQVFESRAMKRSIGAAADEALEITGTTSIADAQVGLLSIGQRRLVELAMVLAGPFDMLLLDEPSSGLDGRETEAFAEVLRSVVAEHGFGILIVEHDMTLVSGICDRVYVLDFGTLIFEGTPAGMHASPAVRAAYLGEPVAQAINHDPPVDPTLQGGPMPAVNAE